jgi:hypothetical protein
MRKASQRCGAAALLLVPWLAFDASAAAPGVANACPLELVGTWQLSSSSELEPVLLSFSNDSWASVLGRSGESRPGDLDILAQVRYEFAPRRDLRRDSGHIEFQARRGNDLFSIGTSRWDIAAYTDESFSARRTDAATGDLSLWSRVQTHRYFLTFAARTDAAFAMWTTLDGRRTDLEALGATAQGAAGARNARFGRIPPDLARAFTKQGAREDDVMMRIELNEAEYRRTHRVLEAWDILVTRDLLARGDPQAQALEFLEATLQSVNVCGGRLRLTDADSTGVSGKPQQPLELVRRIRKINDRRHVNDKLFPFRWQPSPVTAAQPSP